MKEPPGGIFRHLPDILFFHHPDIEKNRNAPEKGL
jgi:hypothetical protein